MLRQFPTDAYPNLAEFIGEHAMQPGYDYANEFDWGLELILDGLEHLRNDERRAGMNHLDVARSAAR